LEICPVKYSVYGYRPSLAANSSFIVLFAIAAVIHTYLGFRWRAWFFMACMLLGCVSAVLGYAGRVMMYYNPFNFTAFMLQISMCNNPKSTRPDVCSSILIECAACVTTTPVYYCAAIYVTLAVTIQFFSPSLSRFKPKYFYWIFIPCDLCSLIVQAAGGGMTTQTKGQSKIGIDLALAGLSFQVFTICMFCGFFGDYLYRYFRSGQLQAHALSFRLKVYFGFLALAVLLITTRCVYRLAELHEGYSGELVRDEGAFIGLEGV
jgi:RTA1 like protein